MKKLLPLLMLCASGLAFGQAPADKGPDHATGNPANQPASELNPAAQDLNNQEEPPMLGVHWARGFESNARVSREAHSGGGSRTSPNMTYHGGKIMPAAITETIFWGTSWGSYTGDKITGMDSWYSGYGNSTEAKTANEYTGTNGQVTSSSTFLGHVIDLSASAGGGSSSAILAEVCRNVSPDRSGNGYYAVYTDTPRGSAGYCAYHSYGTCGGTPVQFAYFFKLDGDSGCDPNDTSGLHSQGLAAIANVSAHELAEARSDPASPAAWYDPSGNENGDKCAWTFGVPLVTFTNNTKWKQQGEWSNAAYTAGTGYANSSGQHGCIAGN